MQFKVPQFIEIEDKVIGPLTIKQFLYLLPGAGLLFILWFFLELWLFILIGVLIVAISLVFAFYRVQGRPFIYFLGAFVKYLTKPRLYLWRKK